MRSQPLDDQELRVLWNEWDPIGVQPLHSGILDEYDFYLAETKDLLTRNASVSEIEQFLTDVIRKRMGLGSKRVTRSMINKFAQKLHD